MGVQRDIFWDSTSGGGVRCSTDGTASDQYLDPSTQHFEGNGGRSIASLIPSGRSGLRGVVVPRATVYGGSSGFDPHKPRLINIDPDIKGQSCVVDLSKITKESMAQAYEDAAQNPLIRNDLRLLAAQTFHNLAVGTEPVGMGPSRSPLKQARLAPIGHFGGAYVVPKSTLGGGQDLTEPEEEIPLTQAEMMSPSVSPRTPPRQNTSHIKQGAAMPPPIPKRQVLPKIIRPVEEQSEPATSEEPLDGYEIPQPKKGFIDQSERKVAPPRIIKPQSNIATAQISAPSTEVKFEIEGWGEFDAMYHEVIKNDCVLVLVYDNRFKSGMRFMPPATDKLMAVKVTGQDQLYFVNSTGTKFTHGTCEYCILVIDQEVPSLNEVRE